MFPVSTLLETFERDVINAKLISSVAAEKFLALQIREYEDRLSQSEDELATFNQLHFDRLPSLQRGYFQELQDESTALPSTVEDNSKFPKWACASAGGATVNRLAKVNDLQSITDDQREKRIIKMFANR